MPTRHSNPTRPGLACGAMVLATACLAWSCGERSVPAEHHLAAVSFPLFDEFQAQCDELLDTRDASGRPDSELTDAVDWATDLDEAFRRAQAEDKAVLLATLVRENGDEDCDV